MRGRVARCHTFTSFQLLGEVSRQHRSCVFDQLLETLQRQQGPLGQELAADGFADCAPERQAGFEREALQRVDGAFADAAGGGIDDAQQRNRVVGILDDFEVRDQVFDLGALVEGESADHVIFQAVAAHGLFKQARLRVGAVEHGGARSLASFGGLAQILGDVVGGEEGFVLAVGGFVVADLGAALAVGP